MFRYSSTLLLCLIAILVMSNCTPPQAEALPTLMATPGPSPTITNTPQPTVGARPASSATNTPDRPLTFQERLESVEGVTSVLGVNTIDFDPGGSGAYIEVEVADGYNTRDTVITLWTHTLEYVTAEYTVPAPLDFNLVINHEGTQTAWRNDGTSGTWTHPEILPPATDTPAPASAQSSDVCSCSGDYYNCSTFSRQSSAQACYNYCKSQGRGDIHKLDNDSDGRACESLP